MSYGDMTVYGHVTMLGQGIDYFAQLHLLIFKCERDSLLHGCPGYCSFRYIRASNGLFH